MGFLFVLAAFSSADSPRARAADGPVTEFVLPTEGSWPQAIIAGPDGNLWCVESRKKKVIRVTPKGEVKEFTVPGDKVLLLQGITVGGDGELWFTSPSDNTIRRMNTKGEFTGEFKITTTSKQKADTSLPRGICAGPDKNVWFAEMYGNKIARITPKGEITEYALPTADSGPYQPVFDKTGKLWVCLSTANKIARFDPATEKFEEFALPTAKCQPRDIALWPDGNIWFS
jgi:virginiamycin B lyase